MIATKIHSTNPCTHSVPILLQIETVWKIEKRVYVWVWYECDVEIERIFVLITFYTHFEISTKRDNRNDDNDTIHLLSLVDFFA